MDWPIKYRGVIHEPPVCQNQSNYEDEGSGSAIECSGFKLGPDRMEKWQWLRDRVLRVQAGP